MKLNLECISCNVNQVLKITNLFKINEDTREKIMRDVLGYLQTTDYQQSNPEVIKGTWDILTNAICDRNPYRDIKSFYNLQVNSIRKEIEEMIENSEDKLHTALKVAIAGNLIDFASSHEFDERILKECILKMDTESLGRDDSNELIESVSNAKMLLYLGDNCGEIFLDKIFIRYLKEVNPEIRIIFGVRGEPIINDVTIEDAEMVKMREVAEVISNGDGSLGTVIDKVSDDFREIFNQADVVIAKGQGNFESLSDIKKENLYFLFMAKCDVVAKAIGVKKQQIVCAKHEFESQVIVSE